MADLFKYELMIEYKHLAKYAPRGVYVLPVPKLKQQQEHQDWIVVMFIGSGPYIGIVKCVITLSPKTMPLVITNIRHPLVNKEGIMYVSDGSIVGLIRRIRFLFSGNVSTLTEGVIDHETLNEIKNGIVIGGNDEDGMFGEICSGQTFTDEVVNGVLLRFFGSAA